MKKQRQILSGLVLASFMGLSIPAATTAQTLSSGYGHPPTPFQVGNGTKTMKAKIMGSGTVCGTGELTLSLPAGFAFEGGASAVIYTAGVAGVSIPLTPSASTSSTATLPLAGIPAAPDSMIVSYQVSAGCSVIGSSSGNAMYNLSTPGCPITSSTAATGALNAQNAQINILSVSNGAVTNTVGYSYNRVITIQNGGVGYVDTVYLDDLAGVGFYISNAVSSTGTLTKTSTVSGTDTMHRYMIVNPTSDGHFNENETFTVTETVTIVGCSGLSANYTAWYGPAGEACTAVQGTSTAGATINNALQPALTIVPNTMNVNTCMGETSSNTLKVVNTGTSVMREVQLNMFSSAYLTTTFITTAQTVEQSGFNPTSFTYKIGESGIESALTLDSTKNFTTLASGMAVGGYVGSTFFHINETLNPGDTLIVNFEEFLPTLNNCSGNNKFLPGIRLHYSYRNGCGVLTQNNNGTSIKPYRYLSGATTGISNTPSDMWEGESYDISFEQVSASFQTSSGSFPFPNGSEFIFTFTFPSRAGFSGELSDFQAIDRLGNILLAPSSFVYDDIANTLTVKYALGTAGINNTTFVQSNFYINNIVTDCSKTGSNNHFGLSIGYSIAGCSVNYTPQCKTIATLVHCPSPCPRGGILPKSAKVRRTNYGLPDNDNNGVPDAAGSLDFNKIAINTVMHGDTLEFKYAGTVLYGSESLTNFTTGHLETQFNGGSATFLPGLMPISANVDIYNSTGTLIGSQSGIPFDKPTASTAKINYSIVYLSSFPSSYTRYNHGDSIVITAIYRAVQPSSYSSLGTGMDEYTTINDMYVGNTMAPVIPESERYRCDILGGNFKWARMFMAQNGAIQRIHAGCDSVTIVSDNHIGLGNGYADVESFGFEYRPLSVFSMAKVKIPAGYEFSSATAVNTYSIGISAFTTRTLNIAPSFIVGDTLFFDIKSLFAPYGGVWHVADEGQVIVYNVNLKPTCETVAGLGRFDFWKYQLPAPGLGLTTLPFSAPDYMLSTGNNISYSKPSVITSSPEGIVTVNNPEAVWEMQIAQTVSGQTANNVWLAKQNGLGTVTITSVERLSGAGGTVVESITPTSGGIYELGNYAGVGNKFYRITASYLNCIRDSIMVSTGWGCGGYPVNEAAAECKEQVKLTVIPQDANLQLTILNQPSNTPIDLCADLNYEILVKSVALGVADDPRVRVLLPGSAGLSYKPGTYELFTSIAGVYVPVADAEVVPNGTGTILTFHIPDALLASMPSLDTFKVKFTLNTSGSCDWISGGALRFTANAVKPCGTPTGATIVTSNPVNLQGAVYDDLNVYAISSTIEDMHITSAYSPASYRFKLVNQGTTPSTSGQKISVEIPAPLQLNIGTVVNVKNHTPVPISVTINAAGNTVYTWNLTPGVVPMDSIVFTADVFASGAVPALICGDELTINELVTQEFTATCASNPSISCTSMQEIASNESAPFEINRPVYSLSGLSAVLTGSTVSGVFTVTNINSIHSAQTAVLRLYKDENSNGVYDAGETLIGTDDIALTTAATQTHNYVIDPAVTGPYAPVVAVLSATYACDDYQTFVDNVLPVELVSFTARSVDNVSRLDWQTGTEVNNKGFYIERSVDGRVWEEIGFVATKADGGNSTATISYNYIDQQPHGENYYRLRQTDKDGKVTYGPVRKVVFGNGNGKHTVKIYPNPTSQLVTIEASKIQSVLLFDVTGRLVNVPVRSDGTIATLDVSSLAAGSYMIQIVDTEAVSSHHKLSVVKQ